MIAVAAGTNPQRDPAERILFQIAFGADTDFPAVPGTILICPVAAL